MDAALADSTQLSRAGPLAWRERLPGVLTVVGGTLLLSAFAAYNRFPLIISDTGTYVGSGFTLRVPVDRPVFYGLLIRALSLGRSYWPVVVGQAAAVSWLVYLSFRHVARTRHASAWTLATATLLTLMSGAAISADTLCPDITVPLLILSFALLQVEGLGRATRVVLGALIVTGALCHTSSLPIATVLAAVSLLGAWVRDRSVRTAIVGGALVLLAWIAGPVVNHRLGAGFRLSRATPAFLMARFAETGILQETLKQSCPTHAFGLCAEQDEIPRSVNTFLWSPNGPVGRAHGMEPFIRANRGLLAAAFATPHLWFEQLRAAVQGSWECLLNVRVSPPDPYAASPYVVATLGKSIPSEASALVHARQSTGRFGPLGWLNVLQLCMLLLSGIALLVRAVRRDVAVDPPRRQFFGLVLLGVLVNAAVCGALSTPTDSRYMARVAWLVLVLGALAIAARQPAIPAGERACAP